MLHRMGRIATVESPAIVVVGLFSSLVLLGLGHFVTPDTWLALVSGRIVAADGPPSADTLTRWTLGRTWTDQQWLGQLALYEIWRVGGLQLTALVHGLVIIASFAATLRLARLRGGSAVHVSLVAFLAVAPVLIVGGNVRTQTFAFPLFVTVLVLLCRDSRAPSSTVFLTFPLLVVWANVHGSVLIGAGLVGLAGVLVLPRQRGWVLLVLPIVALILTPYGTDVFGYFTDLLGNGEIGAVASEWMPPAPEPVTVPYYGLAALTVGLLARARKHLTRFEQLTLVLLLLGALTAVRNLAWFALAATLLLPAMASAVRPQAADDASSPALALAIAGIIACGVLAAALAGTSNVTDVVDERFPPQVAALVAGEAKRTPAAELYVDPLYADWLLFRAPELAGRVPFDIRYELLSEPELRRYRRFRDQIGNDWRRAAGAATLFVLDGTRRPLDALPATSAVLLRDTGVRLLLRRQDVAVIRRASPFGVPTG